MQSVVYTGDALSQLRALKLTDEKSADGFEEIDYKSSGLKGVIGMGWLIRAVQQLEAKEQENENKISTLNNVIAEQNNKITAIETKNNLLESCIANAKEFIDVQTCIKPTDLEKINGTG
jgi:uncharacterized coiled-coil protein SlyX